jgi:hypothetical protein
MSTEIELLISGRSTGISIVEDATYTGMWRIKHKDGRLSDMVNITRAKDAALSFARPRGVGGGQRVEWHRRETVPEARTAA